MSVEHLMMEFTRLAGQRAAGDDSPGLDRRIGWAASALRVAELRAEEAALEALPERTLDQDLRLVQIEAERLSPEIRLHPSAYALDSRLHRSPGRAIDLLPRLRPGWLRRPGPDHWAV